MIIVETLKDKVNLLQEQINAIHSVWFQNKLEDVKKAVKQIDPTIEVVSFELSSTRIKIIDTFDNSFGITRDQNWDWNKEENKEITKYGPFEIDGWFLTSTRDEKTLRYLISLGHLANHCLQETDAWFELGNFMNLHSYWYKESITPFNDQIYELNKEIEKIIAQQKNVEFEQLFLKGEVTFGENVTFNFGNGRRDYIWCPYFSWVANKGGKTVNLKFGKSKDDNRELHKKVKMANLNHFLKNNFDRIVK